MVAWSGKTSIQKFLLRKLCYSFCFAIALTLFSVPALAATEATSVLGELCLLPALNKSFSHYQHIAAQGGWPQVPGGPTLREGDSNERVLWLRKRLVASMDLAASEKESAYFDGTLEEAVQKFQIRHGLTADGLVGAKTLAALNVPIDKRIRQLAASLERCQPLPQVLERRHILVNIADFTLKVFENGKPLFSMPVIVGKTYRQTPVFSGLISSLVLNPSWNVPHNIAVQDLLPKIRKNPGYLQQMHFRIFPSWTSNDEIDPTSIDWQNISLAGFPYRLRQDPGPDNALGQVKFLFPNPHDVYMHDTPARELFMKDSRTFSSGCIRLARPLDLAIYLLQGTSLGSMDSLAAAISSEKTQLIRIPSPIAVHIVYLTAWVDHEGIVHFRPDVYHRNPAL